MLIEPDINPVKLRALEDPILALWLLNLEQNRFGILSTFSHGGQSDGGDLSSAYLSRFQGRIIARGP